MQEDSIFLYEILTMQLGENSYSVLPGCGNVWSDMRAQNSYSVLPGCGNVWSDMRAQNFGRVKEVKSTKCLYRPATRLYVIIRSTCQKTI